MKLNPTPSKPAHTTFTRYPNGRVVGTFPAHAWNHLTTIVAIIALVVLGLALVH